MKIKELLEDASETWDGVNPTTCMFANEADDATPTDEEILKDFIDFCAKELKINELPAIKLRKDPQWPVVNKTFGRYNNDKQTLEVAWGRRHIMDVLRTVAHELTHKHQHERENVPHDAGETGSEFENEANARAGILMRNYARLHPNYFSVGQAHDLHEASGYIPTAAQAHDPRFEMALTVDIRPGALGKNANKLLLNTDAQGHPQQLRADGIVERMMESYQQFKKKELAELKIDNVNGLGAVPLNQEVDYMGLKVLMKPSMFLHLSLPLTVRDDDRKTIAHLEKEIDGQGFGAPFLEVDMNREFPRIVGHDGRHRMMAIKDIDGDVPVEVHIFPRGGMRNKDMTPEVVDKLNDLVVSQSGKYVPGPIFKQAVSENFADGKVKDKSRPGRVKRAGASCNGSVTDLRSKAKNSSGERAKMYHWCANMKSGKKKKTNEVIHHTGIKTKNQDTSGLVNKGEPVPQGKEKRLLGNLVGKLGAYEVYKWDKGNDSAYSVYDPKTRVSQMTISGHNKAHSFEIFGIYGGPKSPIKAADLYAWLVRDQGLTLVSDKYQSPGGQRVWQDLEQRYGRSVNVYAFNMRTNEPINTGADDPESTHGTRGDIAQNVRLVAAPKHTKLEELSFMGSECTKDCSGHQAGYNWAHTHPGRKSLSRSPSFNKGVAIRTDNP